MKSRVRPCSILTGVILIACLVTAETGVQGQRNSSASSRARLNDPAKLIAPEKRAQIAEAFGKLPLQFEENRGQVSEEVKFISRSGGQTLFLTANEAVMALQPGDAAAGQQKPARVRMKLVGASRISRAKGLDELPGRSNYFIGNKPQRWRTNVVNYRRVKYDEVYPGVDLVWHGDQQQLEHDFIVAPGADPKRIRFSFAGARKLSIDQDGALVLQTGAGDLKLLKPRAWQEKDGQKQQIDCHYVIKARREVEFRLGRYDSRYELVIDPILLYSTYFGGRSIERGTGITLDKDGNIYFIGFSYSSDFPASQLATDLIGICFIVKLNPTGSTVLYSTRFGGSSFDMPNAIVVDQDGNAYVTGATTSRDFPTTEGVLQKNPDAALDDAFVVKINPTGSGLIYSTYLGRNGVDSASSITIDGSGNAYLAGSSSSSNLPATGYQNTFASRGIFKTEDRAVNWAPLDFPHRPPSISCLTVAPSNSSILYAASGSRVYKSTDGGNQWTATAEGSAESSITLVQVIAIDPTNPNVIYVGAQGQNLFKSTDGGNTYTRLNMSGFINTNASDFYDILIDPSSPSTVYVGTNDGAFKSVNGGASWTVLQALKSNPMSSARPRVNRLLFDPTNHSILYAATYDGVFKSTNGGGAWTTINNGLGLSAFVKEVFSLVIDPSAPGTLYAGMTGFNGGIFKTIDGGATWSAVTNGLPPIQPELYLVYKFLAVDPSNPNTLYAGVNGLGVYITTNGGASWSASNQGLNTHDITALTIDSRSPNKLYVGVSGGTDVFVAKINPQGTVLNWLTYLGGSGFDDATGIALDKVGNIYLTGATESRDFPTANPLQSANAGTTDAFVVKLNPTGTSLIYSTYFGGPNYDGGRGLAINAAGQLYVGGITSSSGLSTPNAAQGTFAGYNDAFVAKLNATGSAVEYLTYLGGAQYETLYGIALDVAGNIYVTGDTNSTDFPLLDAVQSQFGGNRDAFVAKINPTGSSFLYSTFIGGSRSEYCYGMAVNSAGSAYVIGETQSSNFPTVTPIQANLRGSSDAFLIKIGVEADLAITKNVLYNPVLVGNNFNYVVTVTNNGVLPATGVTVSDPLPAGINFISATPSQGSCANNAGTVTCNVGDLAVNAKVTITLTVTATVAGMASNTANVAGNEADGIQTNNQATVQTTVSTQPSIYGRVALANGNPLPDVAVRLTGAQTATRQTNGQGFYQFASLQAAGNYTVTPSVDDYSFEPPSRSFSSLSADQTADFTATQCAYSISPSLQTFTMPGGDGTINVTAPPRCPWTAVALDNWIGINSGSSGAGNGMVAYSVAPTTTTRSGRIAVAGHTFVVYQSLNPCNGVRFTEAIYPSGISPLFLDASDFNADGKIDIAALHPNGGASDGLRILTGDGHGSFSLSNPPLAVYSARGMASADLNGDGRLDLAVINRISAQIFLANNSGGFNTPFYVGADDGYKRAVHIADLNRDHKPDLILSTERDFSYPYDLSVLLNDGSGGFGAPKQISLDSSFVLGVADINSDGNVDLLAYRPSSALNKYELRSYLGDGTSGFSPAIVTNINLETGDSFGAMTFGDLNGDRKLDAVITAVGNSKSQFKSALGDGSGHFNLATTRTVEQYTSTPVARDFNGDGKLDIAASGGDNLILLLGDGAGGLSGANITAMKLGGEASGTLIAADFNADDRLDLAIAVDSSSGISVFTNRCQAGAGYIISGRVSDYYPQRPFQNLTVALTGSKTATTQTDNGGNYIFTGLTPGGNYQVAPVKTGTDFTPASLSFNNLMADQTGYFAGSRKLVPVSAASYKGEILAPDSIAALFGVDLSPNTEIAGTIPLPYTLAGSSVFLTSLYQPLPLLFVSPTQANVLMPSALIPRNYMLTVTRGPLGGDIVSSSWISVEPVAPGLFTADSSGRGLAAANVLRVKAGGSQVNEPAVRFDQAQNKIVAVPIDVSNAAEEVYLILFGTGFRHRSNISNVTVKIGNDTLAPIFAGAQGSFAGLDQVNVRLPSSFAGRGLVDVVLTVDGKTANTVQVHIK